MRNERRKQYKNYLKFFTRTFAIRPPYQVICDGNFLHHFVSQKMGNDAAELHRLLGTVLDTTEVKAVVVDAAIRELEELGEIETVKLARQLESLRVGKDVKESLSMDPPVAIRKLIGFQNRRGFIVATQDDELRETLRNIPGVPLMFLQRVLIGLEAPSVKSQEFWAQQEKKKKQVPKEERKRLMELESGAKKKSTVQAAEVHEGRKATSSQKRQKLSTTTTTTQRSLINPIARSHLATPHVAGTTKKKRKRSKKKGTFPEGAEE